MTTVTDIAGQHPIGSARQPDADAFVCPSCQQGAMRIFYDVDGVPTNSCILLDSVEAAKSYPLGNIRLGFCDACGFIFNTAFEPSKTEYSQRYEETQAFSGTFNRFHRMLAERLIEKHGLRDKDVVEIGCGKGEFLTLLTELGSNRGVGIDPGVRVERIAGPAAHRMRFIADLYSEKYARLKVDFLACKMTLEHIPEPARFVGTVRRALDNQTEATVFFQIPEAMRILRECAFEDIYYEHCAYFSPGSLARLFRSAGFDVLDLDIEYDGQYLTLEARPRKRGAEPSPALPLEDDLAELRELVLTFPERCRRKHIEWSSRLNAAKRARQTVVLWGSLSKTVSFLTTLGLDDCVSFVTDINPHRHNHFMPKTGQRIVPPRELKKIQPDLVIVMNQIYEQEVRRDLREMGLSPEVTSL